MEIINDNLSLSGITTTGNVVVGSDDAIYFGNPSSDTSWRIIRSGDNLLFQQNEVGTWNTKSTISGAGGS